MAMFFGRVTPEELRANFQHVGRMFGCVPVYIGDAESDAPVIQVRNGWPDWLLDVAHAIVETMDGWRLATDPGYEPGFWFVIDGDIDHDA